MHGNVLEWCEDVYHKNYEDAPTDGSAWITGGEQSLRMLRGGSWIGYSRNCRSAFRVRGAPVNLHSDVGFRVVVVLA